MRWNRWIFFKTALVLTWLAAVSAGMTQLFRYSGIPGLTATKSDGWPAGWSVQPAESGTTLVVTLHPRCPCSRATLGELAGIMSRGAGRVHAIALFIRPDDASPGWEQTDLWKQAASMPAVSVISDPGGRIAAQFGALTSGQVFAFDAEGHLLFSGGITPARGHMGDSVGVDALDSILFNQTPAQTHAPVFGCALTERTQ